MPDISDVRRLVNGPDDGSGPVVKEVGRGEVNEGRILGLAAGERMILSIILFLAATVLVVAVLFATGTIVLH